MEPRRHQELTMTRYTVIHSTDLGTTTRTAATLAAAKAIASSMVGARGAWATGWNRDEDHAPGMEPVGGYGRGTSECAVIYRAGAR